MGEAPGQRVPSDRPGKPRGLGFLRVAWFTVAAWLSAILFISVAIGQQVSPADGSVLDSLFTPCTIAALASLVCIPLALFIRTQTYKRHWRGDRITLHGYTLGCLAVFVGVQPAGLLSLLAVFETHQTLPQLVPLVIAIIVHLANWPHGRPLMPAPPRVAPAHPRPR